jgi:peptidoglycan hydrolase-like protein with peptidoglycan-binding domain
LRNVTAGGLRRVTAAAAFTAAVLAMTAFASVASAASEHLGQRVLREGMRGHDVRVLQQYLGFAGFPTQIDGDFGPTTEQHVVAFERRYHLRANGIVTRRDAARLRAIVANREGTQAVAGSSGGVSYAPAPSASPSSGSDSAGQPAPSGEKAQLMDGLAVAPQDAPAVVKEVIAAANRIATKPYCYGGGHASFNDSCYDCSGSTSYALHGGHLLSQTEDSSEFESYGSPGVGSWITLWTNAGHVYMEIDGLWFDTAAQSSSNGDDRWSQTRVNSASGYIERHPTGW